MVLTVWVAEWVLDEDRRTLGVGDTLSEWLTLEGVERLPHVPPERVQSICGRARALPPWPGTEDGRHPVSISVAARRSTGTLHARSTARWRSLASSR